jgi:hypothetical protein
MQAAGTCSVRMLDLKSTFAENECHEIHFETTNALQRFLVDGEHRSEFSRLHDVYYDKETEAQRRWLAGDMKHSGRHHAKRALEGKATLTSVDEQHLEADLLETRQRGRDSMKAIKDEWNAARGHMVHQVFPGPHSRRRSGKW